jgi:PilZ domain
MEEHRAAPRRRVLKAGTISFGGGGAISCTIRNLSEVGAALDVESPVGIPDQLTLSIEAEHSSRHCQVVWRKERKSAFASCPASASKRHNARCWRRRSRQPL